MIESSSDNQTFVYRNDEWTDMNSLASSVARVKGLTVDYNDYEVTKEYTVKLSSTVENIQIGKTQQLKATVTPSSYTGKLTWSSSNTKVATVSSSGLVKGVGSGTATITVKTDTGNTATCKVTVYNYPLTSISLNSTSLTFPVYDTRTLTVKYSPDNTTDVKGVTWSSSNTKVATVDSNGKITAVGAGTATITAKTKNANYYGKTLTATCKVTVTKISLSNTSGTLPNKTYTGKQIKPSVVITSGGKKLVQGTDYTVTYGANKSVGKGSVKITGKGNYTGTFTKYFYIVPAKVTLSSVKSSAKKKAVVKYKKATGASGYQIAYAIKGSSSWKYTTTTSLSKTISGLTSKKTYQIKVRAYKTIDGKTQYGAFSSIKTVKVK
jgi:uncharacterized protein YjdB